MIKDTTQRPIILGPSQRQQVIPHNEEVIEIKDDEAQKTATTSLGHREIQVSSGNPSTSPTKRQMTTPPDSPAPPCKKARLEPTESTIDAQKAVELLLTVDACNRQKDYTGEEEALAKFLSTPEYCNDLPDMEKEKLYNGLGLCRFKLKNYKGAQEAFEIACEQEVERNYFTGLCRLKLENYEGAREAFEAVLKDTSNFHYTTSTKKFRLSTTQRVKLYLRLAQSYLKLNNAPRAVVYSLFALDNAIRHSCTNQLIAACRDFLGTLGKTQKQLDLLLTIDTEWEARHAISILDKRFGIKRFAI